MMIRMPGTTRGLANWFAFLTLFILVLSGHRLQAQSESIYSTIVGTVTDASGAVVPGATITETNIATNITTSVVSSPQGLYRIDNLLLGTYTVLIEKPGFKNIANRQVTLSTAQTVRIDFTLEVGGADQMITVNAASDLSVLNTENAQISNTFDWDDRAYLPTSSPNDYDLQSLQPATATGSPTTNTAFAGSLNNEFDLQINGVSFRGSYGAHGIEGNYNEWMQQESTDYVNNGAEYQTLGVVNVTTKSGSNSFHGSAVDYYTSGGLQGQSPFTSSRPSLVQNIYATSVGGPIRKDHTFFFASVSGVRSPGNSYGNATVPTPPMLAGNFQGFAPVIDPATGQPFANNQIPAGRISHVASAFDQAFYPTSTNVGGGRLISGDYNYGVPAFSKETSIFARVDEHLSDRNSFFVDYVFDDSPCGVDICFTGSLPSVGFRIGKRRDQNAEISDIHTLSPSAFNEFNIGWSRDLDAINGQIYGPTILQTLGIQGVTSPLTPAIPAMNISGLTAVTQQSLATFSEDVFSLSDTLSWTHGKHTMKFGFLGSRGMYVHYPSEPDAVLGTYSFTSTLAGGTGNAFANFLLGIPASESRQIEFNEDHYSRNSYQFFGQDDIELTKRLTLNLGARYEYYQPFSEQNGQAYSINLQNGTIIVQDQESLQLINPQVLQSFNFETAAQAGYPGSVYDLGEKNIAPRIGFAFRLNDMTVVRGGYGIFYDNVPPQFTPTDLFVASEAFPNNSITNGTPAYQFPNPFAINPSPLGTLSLSSTTPHLRMPYTQQWNLTLQRQLGKAASIQGSYIGSTTQQITYSQPTNIPAPSTTPFAQSRRPLTQFGQLTQYASGVNSNYNAVSGVFRYQTRTGIYINSSYTFAKNLGIGGDVSSVSSAETMPVANPLNHRYGYGLVQYAPIHATVTVINYPLPFGRNRQFLSAMPRVPEVLVGGWNFSSIFHAQSGDHLTPTYTGYDSAGTGILTGQPDIIGNPNGPKTKQMWFNAAAFAYPGASPLSPLTPPSGPIGRYGNAGVGDITGPADWQEDLGLRKVISVESLRLKIDPFVLATNVFNHPNLADPAVAISAPTTVGTITGLRADSDASGLEMRVLQLGVRVEF